MVQRDVYVRKPSLNKLECGQIQPMTYMNLLHRVKSILAYLVPQIAGTAVAANLGNSISRENEVIHMT